MSGHSKWSSIKHQKGVADARRGQLFTKLAREIIVAVREGGANQEVNFRLRLAVQKAHDSNMPHENIERAIKRGSGETDGVSIVEMMLEGYGPGGAAVMVQALTDNRNRTLQDIRNIFSRNGASLGESGCVAWLFDQRGFITVSIKGLDVEEIELQAIDAGADDVKVEGDNVEIYTRPEAMERIRVALEEQNLPITSSELIMMSKNMIGLDEKAALQIMKLLDKLEELDEVQGVTTNADLPGNVAEKYQSSV
ncbi:YebC/PmpR family DNA-binding transcriptional regulator [Chloroflexota bacterium]